MSAFLAVYVFFASVMAASLVSYTLKDSRVFESWPHFEGKCAVG